jgi:5-methylcytosine-specific restriction endonuclease McrA
MAGSPTTPTIRTQAPLPRRGYKRPSGPKYSKSPAARALRVLVYTRDNFTCQHCGYLPDVIPDGYDGRHTIGELTLDHIRSAASGHYLWRADNLQTLCRPCNSRKGHS